MRYRRSFVVLALIALVATAIPATAALIGGLKPSYVDPRIAQRLSAQPTADVVIGFRTAPTNADVIALHKSGFTGPFLRFDIVPAVAATATAAAMSAVRSNPRVERVEFDAELPYTLDRATAVGRVKPLWNATYRSGGVDVPGGITGKGVTVALFDSGIDARHPDLLHKDLASKTGKESVTMANFAILGRTTGNELAGLLGPDVDSITGDSTGTDLLGEESEQDNLIQANVAAVPMINSDNGGHGTHCAGVIAGRGKSSDGKFKGVAWRAKLIGLSGGEVLSVARGIAGMDWMYLNAAKYGIRVMSNSWGPGALEDQPNSILRNAIERLVNDKAISVVFAAGNNGGDGTAIQTTYASNAPSVISVANYFDRTGWVDASSSRGPGGQSEHVARPRRSRHADHLHGHGRRVGDALRIGAGRPDPNHRPARRPDRGARAHAQHRLHLRRWPGRDRRRLRQHDGHLDGGAVRVGRRRAAARGQPVAHPGAGEGDSAGNGQHAGGVTTTPTTATPSALAWSTPPKPSPSRCA